MAAADNERILEDEQEEYQKALDVLNKSKKDRIKDIKNDKKAKKEAGKIKKNGETQESPEPGKGFIGKMKKDPVIPIVIFCLIAAAAGFGIYIIKPLIGGSSLGITVDEFREGYKSTGIYANVLMPYNFEIPELTLTEGNQLALTAASENRKDDGLLYFSASIPNTATSFGTAIQGSVKKSDNKLAALRVLAEYKSDDNYFNFIILYFGSYLQTFIPDLSDSDIETLVAQAVSGISENEFTVRQGIAYRISVVPSDAVSYVAFDIIPESSLKTLEY